MTKKPKNCMVNLHVLILQKKKYENNFDLSEHPDNPGHSSGDCLRPAQRLVDGGILGVGSNLDSVRNF